MQQDTKPWYKQLWPWILIAIPVVTAIKAVHTIVVMQQHSPDLVVDDYYKAGRAINMQLAKYREAALRNLDAHVLVAGNRAVVRFAENTVLDGTVHLDFYHPTLAERDFALVRVWLERVVGSRLPEVTPDDLRAARFLTYSTDPAVLGQADVIIVAVPTPVDDAARVILAVLKQLDCQSPLWGTYHYGGHETTTSLALGQAVLSEARNFRSNLVGEVIAQAHAARPDAVEEPQHAVLACKKILHTFGVKPRAWRTALPHLLDRYYRHV